MPFVPPTFITLGDGFVIDKAETTHPQYEYLVWCTDMNVQSAPSPFHEIMQSLRAAPGMMLLVGMDGKAVKTDLPRGLHSKTVRGYNRMHAEYVAICLGRELRARAKQ